MNGLLDNPLAAWRPAWSRPEAIFIAASLVLLVIFLIPLPPAALSILWVLTFCLAGAAAVICLAAGSSADLAGFVPLVSVLTLLRLAALAGSAKKIIQHESPDPLLQAAGMWLSGSWPFAAALICLLLAAIISLAVFASCQRISMASRNYIKRILPLKHVGIETDLGLGVIDADQAKSLNLRVASEHRLLAGMQAAGLLMRAEMAICVVILLACVILPFGLTVPADGLRSASLSTVLPLVVSLSVFTLVPMAAVACLCGWMMTRDSLILRVEAQSQPPAKKIAIVTRQQDAPEQVELLNPDFANHGQTQFVDFEPDLQTSESVVTTENQSVMPSAFAKELQSLQQAASAPLPPVAPPRENSGAAPMEEFLCADVEEYYEKISRMILESGEKAVLLAAAKVNYLPVTVAVNIAIRLIQKQKEVLLVDSDTDRNALAKVFDLDPQTIIKKAQRTCFESLWVGNLEAEKLHKLLARPRAMERFDVILVYAPDYGQVELGAARVGGFFFGAQAENPPALCGKLKPLPPIHSVLNAEK
ncbi:MAG: FHIPEP family type III secretion protein [Planctomycetaceae bacterium]|nr:FHIPEP family type III secretion protein [Planctomycetaceae bacterium]